MSTITHNFVAKLSVAFVAVAMVFAFGAPAQAQTTEELQQMINDLLSQVASLQAQLGDGQSTGGGASDVCPYTWTRSLSQGDTGNDVMLLQQFLNADPDTRVAASGVGSAGQETQYYGSLTAAAVSKFQSKYRSDVLSPLGLVNATGYFGPSSMSKANALCATAPTPTPTPGEDDEEEEEEEEDTSLKGGEATLDSFDARSGDDTSLEEGQNDAPVMDVRFDVENGDIKVSRIDVSVDPATGNDEDDPWKTFDEISIWVDGDKIAEKSVDRRGDWSKDQPNNGDYRARIAGLDWVVRDGERAEFTVALSVAGGVVDTGNTDNWDIFIPTDGIRAMDAAGVNQYTGDTSDTIGITVSEEGGDDELDIRTSSNNPDATTIEVDDNSRSGWETIFAFDLDTGDSINDVMIETATVGVTVSGDDYDDVVNDARLVIDGQTFDDFTVSAGTATRTLTFDIDLDAEIDAGDRVEAEFQVRFNGLTGNYSEGQTIMATTTSAGWEAETVTDITVGGSATGKTHTLRTEGLVVEPGTHSTKTQGDGDTVGVFEVEFDVTAFGSDFYIAENATTTNASGDGGVYYSVVTNAGTPTSISGALSSTGDEDTSGVFTVREGETETFTLTVTVDASASGLHRVTLNDIWFSASNDGTTSVQTDPANPSTDYRTANQSILN